MTTPTIDFAALRKVCEAATQESWSDIPIELPELTQWIPDMPADDRRHIATFDPPTVKRILSLAERAEKMEAALKRITETFGYSDDTMDRIRAHARTALETKP